MVDWDTVLTPEALGLEGKVHSIATQERLSLDDVPYVEATVVLPAGIPEEKLTWDWVGPIHQAVWEAISSRLELGRAHVRFASVDGQAAADSDREDDAEGDQDGAS